LVIAREEGEGRARRFVVLGIPLGHPDEEERQRLQQMLLRQHLAVEKLDRILVGMGGTVGQPHVVPAKVLFAARVGGGHYASLVSAAR
jgi:hypothetical protein